MHRRDEVAEARSRVELQLASFSFARDILAEIANSAAHLIAFARQPPFEFAKILREGEMTTVLAITQSNDSTRKITQGVRMPCRRIKCGNAPETDIGPEPADAGQGDADGDRWQPLGRYAAAGQLFFSSFAHVSFRDTVRLSTILPGLESGSTLKYPNLSNWNRSGTSVPWPS